MRIQQDPAAVLSKDLFFRCKDKLLRVGKGLVILFLKRFNVLFAGDFTQLEGRAELTRGEIAGGIHGVRERIYPLGRASSTRGRAKLPL